MPVAVLSFTVRVSHELLLPFASTTAFCLSRRGYSEYSLSRAAPWLGRIEAAERLVGVYSVGTSSDSVCVSLTAAVGA